MLAPYVSTALLLVTFMIIKSTCDIIVDDPGIGLTNLFPNKPQKNYYEALNGIRNHINRKSYSSFRSQQIENVKYNIPLANSNGDNLYTELQGRIIRQYFIEKHNNVNMISVSNQLGGSSSVVTLSLSQSESSTGEGEGDSIGDYIIMEDINSFATGGRLTVGETTQLNANNADINALYQQSLSNQDGTIGFTLSNEPKAKEAPSSSSPLSANPQADPPSNPVITSTSPPSSITPIKKASSGNHLKWTLITFLLPFAVVL